MFVPRKNGKRLKIGDCSNPRVGELCEYSASTRVVITVIIIADFVNRDYDCKQRINCWGEGNKHRLNLIFRGACMITVISLQVLIKYENFS